MSGEVTRTRILDAAGPVFAEKGFQAATVRDICQRACVNAASVNYYFGDKETLYIETVRLARQLRARQFPLPERPFGTPPEVRLRDFIVTLLHRVLAGSDVSWNTKLMMREVLHPTKACRSLVEEYIRPQFDVLSGIVRRIGPGGDFSGRSAEDQLQHSGTVPVLPIRQRSQQAAYSRSSIRDRLPNGTDCGPRDSIFLSRDGSYVTLVGLWPNRGRRCRDAD